MIKLYIVAFNIAAAIFVLGFLEGCFYRRKK